MAVMARNDLQQPERITLGIECGGTHTTAVLMSGENQILRRDEFAAGNMQMLSDADLQALFAEVRERMGPAEAVGIGVAGLRTAQDRLRLKAIVRPFWPEAKFCVTNDLETIFAAVPVPSSKLVTRVLLLAGTGSCCFAQTPDDRTHKVGGWGHQLGDETGAYGIALSALRQLVEQYDRIGKVLPLLEEMLGKAGLSAVDDLIAWMAGATKGEIAALAPAVFGAWQRRQAVGIAVIGGVVRRWGHDVRSCLRRLGKRGRVQFVLTGGCFVNQPAFVRRLTAELRGVAPRAEVIVAAGGGATGAARLARERGRRIPESVPSKAKVGTRKSSVPKSTELSPTEVRNPRSMGLDEMAVAEAIELFADEDRRLPDAILKESKTIERVIQWVARGLSQGGRLIYVGAGTSGRLGVLDASECPPTFRSDPERVQGVIAGGIPAIWSAVEGAEDSESMGAAAMAVREVGVRDVVVGIAASGRTPFVWGSLMAAKASGAKTVLLCFNPYLKFARGMRPNAVICPEIGPELLTGSTRLKAGTATKMILNMITTLAMVQNGKVVQNLMVDVNPSNVKLRDRAVRIVMTLCECSQEEAQAALDAEHWVVKAAYQRLQEASR